MVRIRYNFKKKCPPEKGRDEGGSRKNTRRFFRSGHGYGRYVLLLLGLFCITGMAHSAVPSSEPNARDLQCMIYVTPDFQLLPLSAFGLEEGLAVYE